LVERLQLDELCEWCLAGFRAMTRQDLVASTTVAQGTERVMREELKQLGQATRDDLYTILADK
jgi:hypothetical protein